jgi:hypothetical protein
MLKNTKIEIKVNPNSREYYNKMGYVCDNFDIISVNIVDLPSGSNIDISCTCDNCGVDRVVKYNKYYKSTNGNTSLFLCKKCSYIKAKKTKLEKYGDENYTNREKAKKTKLEKYGDENYTNREKAKKTIISKYGVDNISQIDDVKEAKRKTSIKNWGVDNVFKSDEIKDRISKTIFNKYGVDKYIKSDDIKEKYNNFCKSLSVSHYSKTDEFKSKYEKTCIERWGYKTSLLNPSILEKTRYTNLLKYGFYSPMKNKDISKLNTSIFINNRKDFFIKMGYEIISYDYENSIYELKKLDCSHVFKISNDLFRSRIKYNNNSCLVCYPKNDLRSIKEKELSSWIKSLTKSDVIENYRNEIGKEIDIYLPDYKIGIEFNGLYYHSDMFKDKNYHIDKTKKCESLGINLIHIWEDDWVNKKEIVKSIIRNKLGLTPNKIYARKCQISIISNKESRKFLDDNHIQGYTNSSICIALKYKGDIVSVMTFGKRSVSGKTKYELIRFCNKINYNVIGGSSKLFKFFLNNNPDCDEILSYSDKSIFTGKLYENLGFINKGDTSLNYYWTDLNRRYHRFNFNKKRLVKMGYDINKTEEEIMKSIGYYKIWSCGQTRWVFKR